MVSAAMFQSVTFRKLNRPCLARTFCHSILAVIATLAALDVRAEDGAAPGQGSDGSVSNLDLARSIAVTGRQAFNAGDYETAVTLFRRAYALYPAPTVVLYEARSLEKLGQLLEAGEAYERTTQIPVRPGAPAQFAEAVTAARQEGRVLLGRIPTLTLKIEGVGAEDADLRVSINGQSLSPGQVGQSRRLNPGKYRVVGSLRNERTDEASAVLQAGQHLIVVLDLTDPALAIKRTGVGGNDGRESTPGGSTPLMAYVAGGVGLAGIGVGVVTGLMANAKHAGAVTECAQGRCVEGSSGPAMVDAFRTLRTASTVSYGIGAAGVAAGVVLWLTASDAPESGQGHALEPWVTAHTAGLRGTF